MKYLVCPNCGNKETEENLFPGIFTLGTAFETTDREIVGLYGCPKCSTVRKSGLKHKICEGLL